LSVPAVFCNRLKFNEFVKAAEIIWRLPAGYDRRAPPSAMRLLTLKLLWLMTCGLSPTKAWHYLSIDLDKGRLQPSGRSLAVNETEPKRQRQLGILAGNSALRHLPGSEGSDGGSPGSVRQVTASLTAKRWSF
ncbi:hypothetical protein, partial [Mesorhizobium sp. M7A.F.Ca.CA.002.15.2.1]|uniref:hypothetical protein n=1 Tax=Mesorhizobium sp. M7A.F.Ca.CA.002.15.2.1 TaxID=2496678 RepID=UPI0019D1FADC